MTTWDNRDDDIDCIVQSARKDTMVDASALHIVVMLSLICKAVRDLRRANAT